MPAYKVPKNPEKIFLQLYKTGFSKYEIANIYGIHPEYASRILRNSKGWNSQGNRAWTKERRKVVVKLYINENKTLEHIAHILKSSRRHIANALKLENIKIRPRYKFGCGPKSPYWKGGKTISKGYVYIWKPDHPFCTKHGYVSEHRLVMEKKLGRFLSKKEVVHHKNKIRHDNRIRNLKVFGSNAEHLAIELKGQCPKWSKEGLERLQAVREKREHKV